MTQQPEETKVIKRLNQEIVVSVSFMLALILAVIGAAYSVSDIEARSLENQRQIRSIPMQIQMVQRDITEIKAKISASEAKLDMLIDLQSSTNR